MSEKDEPEDIEEDGAEEEHGVGPTEALAATLNRHKREERNRQIDEQHSIIQCPQRSDKRASNLDVDEEDGEALEPVVIAKPLLHSSSQGATTRHMPRRNPLSGFTRRAAIGPPPRAREPRAALLRPGGERESPDGGGEEGQTESGGATAGLRRMEGD